jgi:hypothetical protein
LLLNSGFSRPLRLISVLIQPGAIALTRMPSFAKAIANDLVTKQPPFLLRYTPGYCGAPKYECIEPNVD